ncbi:hypothetical protein L7F22_035973 [Adiantum nelumboides]|nr:hypothetical protein [Adiantum nelumboides]
MLSQENDILINYFELMPDPPALLYVMQMEEAELPRFYPALCPPYTEPADQLTYIQIVEQIGDWWEKAEGLWKEWITVINEVEQKKTVKEFKTLVGEFKAGMQSWKRHMQDFWLETIELLSDSISVFWLGTAVLVMSLDFWLETTELLSDSISVFWLGTAVLVMSLVQDWLLVRDWLVSGFSLWLETAVIFANLVQSRLVSCLVLVQIWFCLDWLAVWFWFRLLVSYLVLITGFGPSAGTQGCATQDSHIAASDSSSDFDIMEGYPMQQHLESSSQDMHALGQQLGVSMFSRLKETLSRATRSKHATNEINEGGGEVDSPFTSQIDPVLSESVHVSTPATTPIGLSKLTPSETLLPDGRSFAEVQEVERYILAAREKEIKSLRKAEQRRATLAKAPMTLTNPLPSPELTTLKSQPIGSHIASGSGILHDGEYRRMPRQKTAREWDMAPYEAHDLSTNEKSHIPDEVLAQITAHIFIAKFRDEEGDNIKTTMMPREIWTLHRRPEVSSAVRAVHLENFFKLPPWGTDYMRAHKLMSSIQYDGKAMITDNDGEKVEVLITKDIINEALHFIPRAYDLIPKTKAIDNEKAFLKVKGSKFKYSDLIYTELKLPLRLISQHLRVQKPPRYTEPFLHMAVVMALCVAEKRQVRCDFAKYILESLIEANLKNSSKNKLYMNVGPMLTRIAYQALGMIEDLPAANSQASLIQQAKYVPKAVRTTSSATSSKASKTTRSKKSSSEEEQTEIDKEQDSPKSAQEEVPKEVGPSVPSEYESDEEDTSIPLERKSQRLRSQEQVLLDKAMARVETKRKELADARAAKAAGKTRPMTMEEARKIRLEKAKAIQKERRRIEAEQRAQEEAEAAKAAPTQETEVVDLSGTLEYLKKLEREKHTAEQRAAQLAREKIKEALIRKAEESVLEPTQGSPKRPRQEEEEDIEDIQADPIPPSPINIPPAPPSSPITLFPPASTPQTPPSPLPLETPLSPPVPTSPQQQHPSAETAKTPAHITKETSQPMEASPQKETAQPMSEVDEGKRTEGEQHQPEKVDVPILMVQDEEPSSQEDILEVRSFDYIGFLQTLTRQFQCQQVVAKETEIQKTRANQAEEEMANLKTALELVTKERDSSAKENENLIRDLMDLQSQLTRKEAQNHELIKNEKKMREQLKNKDARFQNLNTSYNTIKNTLTALLQNQEPAAEAPSTSAVQHLTR